MNNKADIEEDIKIIKNHLMKIQQDTSLQIRISIENILADRERLEKENEEYKIKENSRICGKYNEIEIHDLIEQTIQKDYTAKANKYDSLVEKIKELRKNLNKNGFVGYADEITDILEEVEGE